MNKLKELKWIWQFKELGLENKKGLWEFQVTEM